MNELLILNRIREINNVLKTSLTQYKCGVITKEEIDEIEGQCTYQFFKLWCLHYEMTHFGKVEEA